MKNKEYSNILTRRINLTIEVPEELKDNEDLKNKYIDERYSYLRDGRYAGNKGYNLVMSSVYWAKYLGQGEKEIETILYSYSHSEDTVSGFSIDKLVSLKKLAPITEEVIQNEMKKFKTNLRRKKYKNKDTDTDTDKDDLTKGELKKIEAEEKRLRKFLNFTEDDIQFEINKKLQYNKFPDDINDKWMNGYKQPQRIVRRVGDFWNSTLGTDVLAGRSSLPNRKFDDPICVPKDLLYNKGFTGLYHNYGDSFKKILTDKDPEVFVKLPYKKGEPYMVFKMDLGYKPNNFIRDFIYKIFLGEIEPCDCELNFTENKKTHKNTNLTLFLTGEILKIKDHSLDYDKVMGIDLGWNNPIVWAVNYDTFTHGFLGDILLKNRKIAQIDKEISDLQRSISVHARGGHGRKRKLEALIKVKEYKRNFNKTFNERLSSEVIKKCISLGIGKIKMEDLSGINRKNGKSISKEEDEFMNKIMANWCYYELQKMIEYKAALNGIEVYYIDPKNTSQTCAFCGTIGRRGVYDKKTGKMIDSSKFFCDHEPCEVHKIKWKDGTIHADRNAAMNIARSEKYVESRNKDLWRRKNNTEVINDLEKNV